MGRTSKHYEDYFIQYMNGRFVLNSPEISGIKLDDLGYYLKSAIDWYKPGDSQVSYVALVYTDVHGKKISPLLKERKNTLARIEGYSYPDIKKWMDVKYSKVQLTKSEMNRELVLTVYLVNMDTGETALTLRLNTKNGMYRIEDDRFLNIDADDARALYKIIKRITDARYSDFHL